MTYVKCACAIRPTRFGDAVTAAVTNQAALVGLDPVLRTAKESAAQLNGQKLTMKVFFYGKLASTIGPQLDVAMETTSSVGGLRRHLIAAYPDTADALRDKRVKALVGETLVGEDHALSAHDEVEFLAPVSGG